MSKDEDLTGVFAWVFGVLIFITIIVVLVARSFGVNEDSGPMGDKDIDARTMPYGGVNLPAETQEAAPKAETAAVAPEPAPETTTPAAPAEPVAETPAPAMAAASTPAIDGAALYAACAACHDNGIANAPKRGDKAAWAPRIATGMDSMVEVAIKGKGAMPPKGGRADYSDEQIKAVVEYMVNQSK